MLIMVENMEEIPYHVIHSEGQIIVWLIMTAFYQHKECREKKGRNRKRNIISDKRRFIFYSILSNYPIF